MSLVAIKFALPGQECPTNITEEYEMLNHFWGAVSGRLNKIHNFWWSL